MATKYRKKPVEIEALQYTGTNQEEISGFVGKDLLLYEQGSPTIRTLEGSMTVSKGDFVIKGVQGEFYPCKPDIFAQTYDAVE